VDECAVINHQGTVIEAKEVARSSAVDPVVGSVRPVPASIEHSPTRRLLKRPRSVNILPGSNRKRSEDRHAHIGNPIQRVSLPITRIEVASAQALNFDHASGHIAGNLLQLNRFKRRRRRRPLSTTGGATDHGGTEQKGNEMAKQSSHLTHFISHSKFKSLISTCCP